MAPCGRNVGWMSLSRLYLDHLGDGADGHLSTQAEVAPNVVVSQFLEFDFVRASVGESYRRQRITRRIETLHRPKHGVRLLNRREKFQLHGQAHGSYITTAQYKSNCAIPPGPQGPGFSRRIQVKNARDNIVRLFEDREEDIPEMPLDVSRVSTSAPVSSTGGVAVDLTGKPKVIFLMGAGRAGKSLMARLLVERTQTDGLVLMSMDLGRPTLKQFFKGTMMPESADTAVAWLQRRLSQLRDAKRTAIVDMGADMTLVDLLAQVPNLHRAMSDGGLEPVALYMLTPRQGDLTVLKVMEDAGFQPAATALVLNTGTMMTKKPEAEFAAVRKHSEYRKAIERGAVEVWLPKLHVAKDIEDRGWSFSQAAEQLPFFDQESVTGWRATCETCLAPIANAEWLP
jgi:hypothetical protein